MYIDFALTEPKTPNSIYFEVKYFTVNDKKEVNRIVI